MFNQPSRAGFHKPTTIENMKGRSKGDHNWDYYNEGYAERWGESMIYLLVLKTDVSKIWIDFVFHT